MSNRHATTYLARWVLPIEGPPLQHGFLTVRGGRVVALGSQVVGKAHSVPDTTIDLGDVALLPGFVNAHTHLEFSDLAKPLGHAGMAFPDWIREVLAYRRAEGFDPVRAIQAGLRESAAAGVTSLGDIASSAPKFLFEHPPSTASVVSFIELLGLGEARLEPQRTRLDEFLSRADSENARRAVSPHAPYSTRPALVEAAVARSVEHRVPVAMHLAESREELQLLAGGDGPFVDLFRDLGIWDGKAIPRGAKPLDYLRMLSRAPRALVVHGNYLAPREIEFLAANAERMTTVYCPRTHAYFAHEAHPLPRLIAAGAAVALGTDGRCTNPDLSLLEELRTVARTFPQLSPQRLMQLGTLDGARALGIGDEAGSLRLGKSADFVAVASPVDSREPFAALLSDDARVIGVWKRGVAIVDPQGELIP